MHQAAAAESASVEQMEQMEQDIKSEDAAAGIVSTIMDKYTLADPWPAKNEKVRCAPDCADADA
jgi:hypothetical protein